MLKSLIRRVSTVVVQQFCKLLVGGSNPSPGTNFRGVCWCEQLLKLDGA